jgi:hypothetical protein
MHVPAQAVSQQIWSGEQKPLTHSAPAAHTFPFGRRT